MTESFPTSLRRDPGDPRGLKERIEHQVTERIGEALDLYVMDLLVKRRACQGRPAPVHGDPSDRKEFQALLKEFFIFAENELRSAVPGLEPPPRPARKGDRTNRPLTVQAYYAARLPDYWQRLDVIMVSFTASRLRQKPGFFKRLFPFRIW